MVLPSGPRSGRRRDVVELGKYEGWVGCRDSAAPAGGAKQRRCQPGRWLGDTPDPVDRREAVSMQPKSANLNECQTSTWSTFIAGVFRLGPPR